MNPINIERIESGPASMDKASDQFGDQELAYAEREMGVSFDQAVEVGDANALCPWAGMTTDWDAAKRMPIDPKTATSRPKRQQTFAECMSESLDYSNGPSMTEAMQLILNAARCTDDTLSAQARRLLKRMSESFAYHNS